MFFRVLAAASTLIVAAAVSAAAWPQLFGLEQSFVIAHAVSLRGPAVLAALGTALLLGVLALASRRARRFAATLAAVMVMFSLVSAAVLATRGFAVELPDERDGELTVLAWNTLGEVPSAQAIADLAADARADVISLPETTEQIGIDVALLMREAGNPMWVHTTAFDDIAKARSTTLLISARLGDYTIRPDAGNTSVLPSVIADPVDGDGPTIVAVHAVAPLREQMENWRADLAWLAGLCRESEVIMAGDFNATIDHMARLADPEAHLGGCRDAAVALGGGGIGTWPTALPALLGAPIDHVMATEQWRPTGMEVQESLDGSGSDHRPVVVRLSREP